MSKEYVEYAVIVDWPHVSAVTGHPMTDIESARLWRDTVLKREAFLAKQAGVAAPKVRLVMHTVSPWCEVYEPKEKGD